MYLAFSHERYKIFLLLTASTQVASPIFLKNYLYLFISDAWFLTHFGPAYFQSNFWVKFKKLYPFSRKVESWIIVELWYHFQKDNYNFESNRTQADHFCHSSNITSREFLTNFENVSSYISKYLLTYIVQCTYR